MKSWFDFYRTRDPDRYLAYAKRRYEVFLSIIHAHYREGDKLLEAGCGMGTITRALRERGVGSPWDHEMVDKCGRMLELARQNVYGVPTACCDTRFLHRFAHIAADIVHSHGVLEHFDDADIRQIIRSQRATTARVAIHYVPGEKYDTPSFGDERLMSAADWQRIAAPDAIVPFNDGFDYVLIWRFK